MDQLYELLWWFAYEFTANRTAKEVKIPQQRVHNCFSVIRRAIYDCEQSQMRRFCGGAQVDETYVGPKFKNRTKGKRQLYRRIDAVRRIGGAKILKQPVFGLYQRNGQVYVEFVGDVGKKTLLGTIKGRIVLESEVYTDTRRSYRGLKKQGYHHEVIDHGKEEYLKQKRGKKIHINCIEGFWGYLKEYLLKHHGVSS